MNDVLYGINEIALFIIGLLCFALSIELGHRLGLRERTTLSDSTKSQVSAIQGALLGLLALLLGFTFAMAMNRFETRKQLIVKESNAIETVALRAQFLPTAERTKVLELLPHYIDARLAFHAAEPDPQKRQALYVQTTTLQHDLWTQAASAESREPQSSALALFSDSLNTLINVYNERTAALRNHVPETILILLSVVIMISLSMVGYVCGLHGSRVLPATLALVLMVSLVLFLIIDLDRPRRGLITVSQQTMLDLRDRLQGEGVR